MKKQSNRDYQSNDDVQTPLHLALQIVNHFQPSGIVLEPCCGDGNFIRALGLRQNEVAFTDKYLQIRCGEIKQGQDFLSYDGSRVGTILTNPPWSKIRAFMQKSFEVADNVIFLITVNHAFTTARERIARAAGFGLREIYLVDWPNTFPKSGFLLGAVHWQRDYSGPIHMNDGRSAETEYMTPCLFDEIETQVQVLAEVAE